MDPTPRVVPVQDFDLQKLTLDNFENRTCDVVFDQEPNFVLKTEKMKVVRITQTFVDLLPVDDQGISTFNLFDDQVISILSEKSNEWFNKTLSIDDIDDMYTRPVKHKKGVNVLRVYIDETTDVYNSNKDIVSIDELVEDSVVKCILNPTKLTFQQTKCNLQWRLMQCILLKEKSKKKLLLEDD